MNEKTVKHKFRTFFFCFFFPFIALGNAQHSVTTKLALKDEKKKEKYCFNPGILLDFYKYILNKKNCYLNIPIFILIDSHLKYSYLLIL